MKLYIITIILCFAVLVNAQINERLKNYLWEKDFRELINNFADEKIELVEQGHIAQKIEERNYTIEEGFRVQLFAGADKDNANRFAKQVRQAKMDSTYIVEEAGIYKVQLGNYVQRLEAEKMLDKTRYAGFPTAWIVTTSIHVPKDSTQTVQPQPQPETSKLVYAIQLFVTNNNQRAEQLKNEYTGQVSENVWIFPQGTLFKILAGKFDDEQAARNYLEQIKASGITDAWLTQVDVKF